MATTAWSQDKHLSSVNLAMSAQQRKDLQAFRNRLPIFSVKGHLLTEIQKVKTAIIIGETGSGKTTQIPQYLYERGLISKQIAVTQPRRVAAISLAQRVATELGVNVGGKVGYCVRFEDVTSPETKIKFMTDGMMLRETLLDPLLKRYSVIILDEAHERTVQTDILFGVVKAAQRKRTEQGHHPLKVFYTAQTQSDYMFASIVTLFQLHKENPDRGDVLIFLTGQDEIDAAVKMIRSVARDLDHSLPRITVYPLYAALPSHQQLKVFEPAPQGVRKVVVSTNIAETSVTISGIKYVIDSGRVKAKVYNPNSGLDLLRVVQASKDQCIQRMGRAGREEPGTCYRLFTEREFERFRDNTMPEIQRSNLASVVLQLLGLGITRVFDFDFIDPPSEELLSSALIELQQLGAVEGIPDADLTPLGKQMLAYPLVPRLAKVLLLASTHGCLEEILTIVSMLSVDSVMVNPTNKKDEAQAARDKFMSSEGDHITLLNIFRAHKAAKSSKQFCQCNFLNGRNLSTATSVRKQLRDICTRQGLEVTSCGRTTTSVRKCLAAGFFMSAAQLQKEGEYLTLASNEPVSIHPSSALARSKPAVVIYTELVKTTKCYMRDVSVVDPSWLTEAATDYFRRKRLGHVNT
ncbi:hypothetical protein C0Q70_11493 [Pomacea canaliculata]|uniref:RNA helicase n=1 Tax=Pomacea canaliculata TaxID=400727 RepID=A0A2T7P654_POMCA|nr:hypothetical protein C0Q70_11493 [Pomacea canaliculata]